MKDIKVMSNEQQVNHMENCWSHNVNKPPYPNIQTLTVVCEKKVFYVGCLLASGKH